MKNLTFDFLTEDLLVLMKERDLMYKRARKHGLDSDWACARALRSQVASELRKARQEIIKKHIASASGDSLKFWRYINGTFFKKKAPSISEVYEQTKGKLVNGIEAANYVNNYFCHISVKLSGKFVGLERLSNHTTTEAKCLSVDQISVRRVEEQIGKIDRKIIRDYRYTCKIAEIVFPKTL